MSLFRVLKESSVIHSHGRGERILVSSGSSLLLCLADEQLVMSAILGWKHKAWCSAIFSSLPSQQPSFNARTGSGHSSAAACSPRSHPLPDLSAAQMEAQGSEGMTLLEPCN